MQFVKKFAGSKKITLLKKFTLILLVLAIILIPLGCNLGSNKKGLPAPTRQRPGVSGFYVNEQGPNDSLPSLKGHSNVLDEFYPLWYHVRPDGSLKEEPVPEATTFAHSNGIKNLPLINVVPSQDSVLRDVKARDNAINNIIRIVKANNYDGVNIDFEFVPTTGRKDFSIDRQEMTTFMKLLNNQLKRIQKGIHMCVLPLVGVSPEMSNVYDYSGLAPFVEKVTIMCYDHSQEGSPPGPLAPFQWVEQNIKTAIKQGFKPSQICLGVATYGYDWPAGKSGGFTSPTRKITKEAVIKGHQIKWSDKYQEPYYIYKTPEGIDREVWFENANTLRTKLKLVSKYGLAGICIWRLGYEDKKFWSTLEEVWGPKRKAATNKR
jgi:spore germination protein YaaH